MKGKETLLLIIVTFLALNICLLCLCKSETFKEYFSKRFDNKVSIFEMTGVQKDDCIAHRGNVVGSEIPKDLKTKCKEIEFVNKEDWGAVNRNRLDGHNNRNMCLNACFDNWSVRRDKLYTLLTNIVKVCDKLNIKWTLYYGGLLGWYRNKELIPWDPDLDILMNIDDLKRIGPGIVYEDDDIQFRISNKIGNDPIGGLFVDKHTLLYCDIFYWREMGDIKISWMGTGYLNVPKKDFFPFKEVELKGIKVPIPQNPGLNLKTRYKDIIKPYYVLKDGKYYQNK